MKYCKYCGKTMEENEYICTNCGKSNNVNTYSTSKKLGFYKPVIITVITILTLALMIFLNYATDYKRPVNVFFENMKSNGSANKILKVIPYKEVSEDIVFANTSVTDVKDFHKGFENNISDFVQQNGIDNDYVISYEICSEQELTGDELTFMRKMYRSKYGIEIDRAYKMNVRVIDSDENTSVTVHTVRINKKWYIDLGFIDALI